LLTSAVLQLLTLKQSISQSHKSIVKKFVITAP